MKKVFFTLVLLLLVLAEINGQTISFGSSDLQNANLAYPTSLQFGPDGRLYVSQVDGTIKALTVVRDGLNSYRVTNTEIILLIKQIPNHDDNGTLNPNVNKRQVTGILVTGTAQNPVIYVSSSDPRVGAGMQEGDVNLDTNSGMLSRLTWNGSAWVKLDLVRGLPRSEENHSPNGMALDKNTNTLYMGIGGHTNMGALSTNLAYLPEYAYSAAVIKINLNTIGETTYDLPTLDDEDRPGVNDANDPFGGNDGKNQAVIVQGGPVQIYASGFRNPYDIVITQSGRIYTFDNGPNAGWGGPPQDCITDTVEGGKSYPDGLHLLSQGYYGGHPNTTRANRLNTFNITNPQSPIPSGMEDPRQCTYQIPGVEDASLTTINSSTNGLAEYTASNFNNAMKGNLIAAVFDGGINRIVLNSEGTAVVENQPFFTNFGTRPLDVTTRGDNETFPGTIWVANMISATITVFEPSDNSTCDTSDPNGDADEDGYTNADESSNGTDPCNHSSIPSDWDKDHISDLNDPDDDNDGIADINDYFAIDKDNGTTSNIPVIHTWNNDEPAQGGILNLGFTGLMINGTDNYKNLYDPGKMTAGGAAGVLTIDEITSGDALGNLNNQEYGFQFGVNTGSFKTPFIIHSRINAPFAGFTPSNNQSMGIFFGKGDQDNYLKIAAAANNGNGGIEVVLEQNGVPVSQLFGPGEGVSIINKMFVDFYLLVDPTAHTVQASYSVNAGPEQNLGAPLNIPPEWISGVTAVGVIATSRGAVPFPVTWDMIEVVPLTTNSQALFSIIPPYSNPNSVTLNQSTYNPHSFRILNTSPNGQKITKVTINLSSAIFPDMVFDPLGKAGDIVGKKLTPDSNAVLVGYSSSNYLNAHDEGYDGLEINFTDFNPGELFTFSIDVDPTSIQGSGPGGPRNSGSVSGIELTGSKVRIDFSDGSSQTGEMYRIPKSKGGSQNLIKANVPAAPQIDAEGISTIPFAVNEASQNIKITGIPGAKVKLLQLEGGLFRAGVPGGGFDIDPFEANSVVAIKEDSSTIGQDGTVIIPVTLTRTDPDSAGLNYMTAVIEEQDGRTSDLSNIIILELRNAPFTAIRINSGSNSSVTYGDITFVSDRYFTGTKLYSNQNITDIAGTDYDELYKTERSSDNVLGTFSYNIPVPNGNYSVWLHFAEIWFGATGGSSTPGNPGDRVFSVSIEGTPVLSNYDIIADVGTMTAVKKLFYTFVGDGELNIDFSATANRPKISAIEVLSPGDIPLLVELSNFSATAEGRNVQLSWTTSTEVNNLGFEIERGSSPDNFNKIIDWNKITFVHGAGNSTKLSNYSYTDNVFTEKGKYRYRLKQINLDGSFTYSKEIEVNIQSDLNYEMSQNFPNPFNPTTIIKLIMPEAGKVRVAVYNLLGEEVALLLNDYREAGSYNLEFNASGLNSGVYFYKMETKNFSSIKKMILMK